MLQLRHCHVFALHRRTREAPGRLAPSADLLSSKEFLAGDVAVRINVRDLPIVKDPDFARSIVVCRLPVDLGLNHPVPILLDDLHVPQLHVLSIQQLDEPDPEISPVRKDKRFHAVVFRLAFYEFIQHVGARPLPFRAELIIQGGASAGQNKANQNQRKQKSRNADPGTKHRHDLVATGHSGEHVEQPKQNAQW
jgi:hypothetical protein